MTDARWGILASRWARLARALRFERPRPRVRLGLGASIPGVALRAVQVAVALACTATVATNGVQWALVVAGLVVLAYRPMPALLGGFVLAWGVGLALAPADPFAPRVFILLFGVHLFVLLGWMLSGTAWSARFELRAFAAPARRFVSIQLFAQALALVAAWTSAQQFAVAWLTVLACAALAACAWIVSGRLAAPHAAADLPADAEAGEREDGWSYRLDT